MSITVKLNARWEARLRAHAAARGRTVSEVMRTALETYLEAQAQPRKNSALQLGTKLFGRFRGPADMATKRKSAVADVWVEKRGLNF